MKRVLTLSFALILGFVSPVTATFAETVLICHAQSVPVVLDKSFKSPLSTALVDGVFDYYFSRGDIAFDQPFSLADGVPSSAWLGTLSGRYGADRVVYFQVIWKVGEAQEAVLDRVDYQVVGPQGTVLRDGSFSVDLTSGAKDEGKQVQTVTNRILAGISS